MKVITTILVLVVLLAAGFFIFIYSGVYNIAASEPHFGPIRWVLETTMANSVRAHADEIETPPLTKQDKDKGFKHFDGLCVTCHGAPGVSASEIGIGLRPQPPELSQHVGEWRAAELFWITQHGFKYTGMPAFGKTHTEEDLWNIVAFLEELPKISAKQYKQLRKQLGSGSSKHQHQSQTPLPQYETQQHATIQRRAI